MGSWNARLFTSVIAVAGAVACSGSTTGAGASLADGGEGGSGSEGGGGGGSSGAASGDDGGDASWVISGGSSGGSSSGSGSSEGGAVLSDGGSDQIACGAAVCDSLTQVCCATRAGRTCTTRAACTGDTLACSGTNSCSRGICCEELTASGAITTRCLAACPTGSRQLCTTAADCKASEVCRRGLDGYGVCVVPAGRDGGAASDAGGD